ncbi:Pectin lyase-like superfamily protein [Abeliophyllum distichum]|uniref:Pectin lyase-like superfamily protein n=1 Tax=Abeliophyllum distichum TaxID=126358 RepID=A0ABD1QEQ2_9LAMI
MKLYEFQEKLREKSDVVTTMPTQVGSNTGKSNGRVFYPIGYGADPTGVRDSSDSILAALMDAGTLQNGLDLLPGITDLGGIIIDFQGGNFRIGQPIRFPPGVGNIVVKGGSLRASNTFPDDRHLIELWSPNSRKGSKTDEYPNSLFPRKDLNNGMYYEDITFRDILFDSSYRGGGLFVVDSARIRVNNCFFIHFNTEGILVERGHETFISSSFLGQHPTIGGDRGERDYTGTGIDLASTDNAVTDVAIFSAATGIILRGLANIITGVHCYNKATYFGGVGILVKAAQTRITDSYLDYNSIVIEDPSQVHVSNGFFLGDGNVVLKSTSGRISGLNIINNMFCGDPKHTIPIVKLDGEFTSIDQVVVDHNNVNGMSLKSTVGKMTVAGVGTRWMADFSSTLLFPNKINHVQYALYTLGGMVAGFPTHAVTNISNNVVLIESEKGVDGVISVFADQHNMVGEGNFVM